MEIGMEKLCFCCNEELCLNFNKCKSLSDCEFNLIIHENEERILFYNFPEKRIFKIQVGKGMQEIDFKDAIREIDIIPTKDSLWKTQLTFRYTVRNSPPYPLLAFL